ncbi:hypothetical protein BST81_18250 [Leptolyngbya sp. 'hensonii']|uniref:hypothetical protein n=1 Tax=Leptolyngbya sp. 'hensonii' TaxID=1922337 RepID=UPI00094F74DE|nr:hypothetical protein [Leptolyngbya sp. 'hensonii']OLP16932.1 hypothetical protein BST81_18250 [Leptolyngbya sp. 'hensonii']
MTLERWTDDQMDKLTLAVEANTQVAAQLAQGQKAITEVMERMANSQSGLSDSQASLTRIVDRMEASIASTNAAVERLERIVDYLLRRDQQTALQDDQTSQDGR